MNVGLCSIDRNNAAPLKEASRNQGGRRVVDKARSFRLYGPRYTKNRGVHCRRLRHCRFYVGDCLHDQQMARSISCLISFFRDRESKNVDSLSKSNRTRRKDRCCRRASPRNTAAVKSHIASASFLRVRQVPLHTLSVPVRRIGRYVRALFR